MSKVKYLVVTLHIHTYNPEHKETVYGFRSKTAMLLDKEMISSKDFGEVEVIEDYTFEKFLKGYQALCSNGKTKLIELLTNLEFKHEQT